MSKADIKKFCSKVIKDQDLLVKMWKGTASTEDVIRNAVKEAKIQGYKFSVDEGKEWWNENRQLIKDHGQQIKEQIELLNNQLEMIVSGKQIP
jgi:translation initiation factor 2B subunit (eIF-2B alpha/beta/delta family)